MKSTTSNRIHTNGASVKDSPPSASPLGFLEALSRVSETDLAAIEQAIAERERELDALKEARRLIDVKLHGKPQRAAKGAGQAAKPKLRELIHDIVQSRGPGTFAAICTAIRARGVESVTEQGVRLAVGKSDWFTVEDGKVFIRTTG